MKAPEPTLDISAVVGYFNGNYIVHRQHPKFFTIISLDNLVYNWHQFGIVALHPFKQDMSMVVIPMLGKGRYMEGTTIPNESIITIIIYQ